MEAARSSRGRLAASVEASSNSRIYVWIFLTSASMFSAVQGSGVSVAGADVAVITMNCVCGVLLGGAGGAGVFAQAESRAASREIRVETI